MCSRLAATSNTRQFDPTLPVRDALALNGCRRDIFALSNLEYFLCATCGLEAAHIIELALVASAKPSILCHGLLGGFFVFEVAHHHAGRFDLNLSILRNPLLHTNLRLTHISYTATSWFGPMRVYDGKEQTEVGVRPTIAVKCRSKVCSKESFTVEVLGHPIALEQLQSQLVIPRQDIRRERGAATASIPHTVQAQCL